jgi:hypothetical protein
MLQNRQTAARFAEEKLDAYIPPKYTERWIVKMIVLNLGMIFTFVI